MTDAGAARGPSKAPFVVALIVLVLAAVALLGWWLRGSSRAPFDPGFDPFGDIVFPDTEADRAARMILHGAERAYRGGLPETALRFYEDVDLRFSHTEVYAQACGLIWEEMTKCHVALGAGAEAAPRYIAARKALHERWLKLKAGPRTKADVEAFLKDLPPDDGRRPQVEAWVLTF
jgi:hypothetical protein